VTILKYLRGKKEEEREYGIGESQAGRRAADSVGLSLQ